jgi:hypothetical protein
LLTQGSEIIKIVNVHHTKVLDNDKYICTPIIIDK